MFLGTSLVVQWPIFCTSNTGVTGLIPDQGTRSHIPQLKILHTAIKNWHSQINRYLRKKNCFRNFPGGPVVKNPPASAGATGSIPDLGRSYMLWSNYACVPKLLQPTRSGASALQQKKHRSEKLEHHSQRVAPARCNQRKPKQSKTQLKISA